MAEVVGLTASALSVAKTLDRLVKYVKLSPSKDPLNGALGEVEILRAVFMESVTMMQDSACPPPESARVAVKRCQKLEKELLETLKSLGVEIYNEDGFAQPIPMSQRLLHEQKLREKLREIGAAFRSAVLLLRDIAIRYAIAQPADEFQLIR
jgi:hypothetical protein